MPSALITGITGQDGSFLAEFLLGKGYRVAGLVRKGVLRQQIWMAPLLDRITLFPGDLLDRPRFEAILGDFRPDEVYNLAAHSSLEDAERSPSMTAEVNGLAPVLMLEAISKVDPRIRFCQASSSEIFGVAQEAPQSETTPLRPRNPYGNAKAFAHQMVGWYREKREAFACSAILYNHESPRRPPTFVTRLVSSAVARIKRGREKVLNLRSLTARRDWSFAGDVVAGLWLMLQQPAPDDFVLSSGILHSVQDLCQIAFSHAGLDWRNHVREDRSLTKVIEDVPLVGDARKAALRLGWKATLPFEKIIQDMVDADLEADPTL